MESKDYLELPFQQRIDKIDLLLVNYTKDEAPEAWARLVAHRLEGLAKLGDYDFAKKYLDEVKDDLEPLIGGTDFYIFSLYPMGFISIYGGDIEAGLSIVEKMKDADEFSEKAVYRQYADNILVGLYTSIGDSTLAAKILIETYDKGIYKEYRPVDQLKLLSNIAFALIEAEEYDEAEGYIKEAMSERDRMSEISLISVMDSVLVSWFLNENLTKVYLKQGRYKETEALFPDMDEAASSLKSPRLEVNTNLSRAAVLAGKENFGEAYKYLRDLMPTILEFGSVDLTVPFYTLYAEVLTGLGRHEEALKAYLAKQEITKKVDLETVRARAGYVQAQLSLQQQKYDIDRLKQQQEAVAIIRKRERYILILSIGGLIFSSVLASLLFHSIARMKKVAQELVINEQKAQEAVRAKATFLANMSHEIRTPLNGLMGMAQILSTRDFSKRDRDCLDAIISSGDVLLAVVNDVLDISKIEAGKMEIERVPTKTQKTIDQLARLWRPKAEEKGISLAYDISQRTPDTLLVDAVRIRQCLSNLISNAIKFTSEGSVKISVDYLDAKNDVDSGRLAIAIKDSGIGIKQSEIERLFSAFEQADSSTTRKFGGTGLGLSITAELGALMQGDVKVESEEGVGSTFTLTVAAPRVQTDPALIDVNGDTDHASQTAHGATDLTLLERILLVDDNKINRMVARAFAAELSTEIVEAENGRDALERLAEGSFDLVLLDMQMPVMDGPTTLKVIRASNEKWREIPIITLTADAMDGDRERYIDLGADGYLSKPLVKADLMNEVNRLISGKRENKKRAA
ncbi:MAG: ATP-binding protein [Pseudomonadota bacterium]